MTAEERKRMRMLANIFDSVTASAHGVDRLEPCEDWRPYIVAAVPSPCQAGNGAEDGTRTRDPHLGKVMLYQLSHFRVVSGQG